MGKVVAFYGFKGGVGRSLIAANVASALALTGKRVLVVDWDIEAPGIGDFLDFDKGAQLPERWRTNKGVFDLLAECSRADASAMAGIVAGYLPKQGDPDAESPLIKVEFKGLQVKDRALDLLGPGRWQKGTDFAASLIASEWTRFFESKTETFYEAFRKQAEDYDAVIIDTRTGFVLSTVFALRFLADEVILVSPKTHQSIEGISRMRQLLASIEHGSSPLPKFRVLLGRHGGAGHEDAAEEFVRELFGADKPDYRFPHLEEITDGEQLFINNSRLGKHFFPRGDRDDLNAGTVREYRDAFWRLCKDVAGVNLRSYAWGKVFPPELTAEFYRAGSLGAPAPQPLSIGKDLVRSILDKLVSQGSGEAGASEAGTPARPKKAEVTPEIDKLIKWYEHADLFSRSSLRVFTSKALSARNIDEAELPQEIKSRLRLDLGAAFVPEPGREAEAEAEPGSQTLPEVEPKQTVNLAELFRAAVQEGTRRWREACKAADEEDDPCKAATLFREAIGIMEGALAKARVAEAQPLRPNGHAGLVEGASDKAESAEVRNDRAVYVWWLAQTQTALGGWEEAMDSIWGLLAAGGMPEGRAAGDSRTVSTRDLHKFLLSVECGRIAMGGPPLDPAKSQRLARIADELEQSKVEDSDADRLVKQFRALTVQARPNAREDEVVRLVGALAQSRHEALRASGGATVEALAQCAMNYALLARFSTAPESGALWKDLLNEGRAKVDAALAANTSLAAGEIVALAGSFSECGNPLVALGLFEDALQTLGVRKDGESSATRARAVASIGLCESSAGRPDMALETWSVLREALSKEDLPRGSVRAQEYQQLEWWRSCAKYLMGEFSMAWEELNRFKSEREKALINGGLAAPDRFWIERDLASIRSWLPSIALGLGMFPEARECARAWEFELRKVYSLEIDAARRIAFCRYVEAQAAYCEAGGEGTALGLIEDGQRLNCAGAGAFGSYFALLQEELVLLREEIRAFGPGGGDSGAVLAACKGLRSAAGEMLDPATTGDWFFGGRVRVAVAMATAAAILLAANRPQEAEESAHEVLHTWLSFPAAEELGPATEWCGRLARVPRALARATLAKLSGDGKDYEAARVLWNLLPPGLSERYSRIFDFCAVPAVASKQ